MLDKLFLNKLTKQGKIYYWLLQLTFDVLFIATLFLAFDYTFDKLMNKGINILMVGVLSAAVISGLICLTLWKKPSDDEHLSKKL